MKNKERHVWLACTECGNRFYTTGKPPKAAYKIEKKKFCRFCRSHELHREKKL